MILPPDVIELVWLYQEWQRSRGEEVAYPVVPAPGTVIDGFPNPQPKLERSARRNRLLGELTARQSLNDKIFGYLWERTDGRRRDRDTV